MASSPHQQKHDIFKEDLDLTARVLRDFFHLDIPEVVEASELDTDHSAPVVVRQSDTVIELKTTESPLIVVIEPQGRVKADKPGAWAWYLSRIHAKYRCPVELIVICHDQATADWARRPMGVPGIGGRQSLAVSPLVLGPDNTPRITDPRLAAADIHKAILCALTHSGDPELAAILDALALALDTLDTELADRLAEFTEDGLGAGPAGEHWRHLMDTKSYRFTSISAQEFERQAEERGKAEGRAEGKAETLLRILAHRGIDVPADQQARILRCHDLVQLDVWLDQAFDVTSADQLTDPEDQAPGTTASAPTA